MTLGHVATWRRCTNGNLCMPCLACNATGVIRVVTIFYGEVACFCPCCIGIGWVEWTPPPGSLPPR